MVQFYKATNRLMRNLGLSETDIETFNASGSMDFMSFLRSHGAKQVFYRQDLRSREGVGHTGILLTGGMSVIITQLMNGKKAVLVQHRENNEIGFPGGGTEVWQYGEKIVAEQFILTAYREFLEETGHEPRFELTPYCEDSSTITYPNGDVTFSPCMFYIAEVDYETAISFASGESAEGKMELIEIDNIKNYKIFDNHSSGFEKLIQDYNTSKNPL